MSFQGILHGVKAEDFRDAGYIYAPHVPLTQTPVVLDPGPGDPEVIEPPKIRPSPFRDLDDDWNW